MKKIAVITPVFNGERFIAECIKSVALLIRNNNFMIEHIVIDDGSTDNSWKIIQDNKVPKMKSFRLEKNSGESAARNYGIKQSDADFLFCLDADDVIFQNSLRALFEFSKEQKADWIYGGFLGTDEKQSYLLGRDYYGHKFNNPRDLLSSIFLGDHFFQGNCFYSTTLFISVGGFDEKLKVAEDLDMFIRFALAGHYPKYLPAPLYLHRFHENNTSKIYGLENNLNAHKESLKTLFRNYNKTLETFLTMPQLKKIKNFLGVY